MLRSPFVPPVSGGKRIDLPAYGQGAYMRDLVFRSVKIGKDVLISIHGDVCHAQRL